MPLSEVATFFHLLLYGVEVCSTVAVLFGREGGECKIPAVNSTLQEALEKHSRKTRKRKLDDMIE